MDLFWDLNEGQGWGGQEEGGSCTGGRAAQQSPPMEMVFIEVSPKHRHKGHKHTNLLSYWDGSDFNKLAQQTGIVCLIL